MSKFDNTARTCTYKICVFWATRS